MKVFFPGSFDPFTLGHADLVKRALNMGFEVVIGVGVNSDKHCTFTATERVMAIREYYAKNIKVSVNSYEGLTANAAKDNGCCAILRGVRNGGDYEYEKSIFNINQTYFGMETILLPSKPMYQDISSSMVREISKYSDASSFVIDTFKKFYEKKSK